ncbi:MAG: TlpA family protein disulfide reductase [Candidatus Omnitrophica bacterium]|nr:TlpA family protein disulfide reductase [Candidatus Omnitrophota bacterium]
MDFSALNDSSSYTYDQLIESPEVVLMFWTSQCMYCRRELEKLNKLGLEQLPVPIFFVNLGESRRAIEAFLKDMKINPDIKEKVVMDPDLFFVRNFGVLGVPTYFFFADKEIVYKSYRLSPETVKGVFVHE